MGTIAGGDGPGPFTPDTGVAPGASWIAAKGCEDLGCSSESLLSAGQFILAPTDLEGNNPDPSRRPDIVNNSWGSDDPNDTFYLETVQAWRAAGIIPVFSAGNAGEFGCGTAGTPGNFTQVISLGATDIDDNIASFSSRGPSPTDKVSPNVSAPGVDVVSSVPGGGYAAFSGTSMASPHATGTIALMLSSKPSLIGDFDAVLDLLNLTAIDRPDDSAARPTRATTTRTSSTARAGSTRRPRSTSPRKAARCPAPSATPRPATRSPARTSPRTTASASSTRRPMAPATTRCSSPPAPTASARARSATRATLVARVVDRDRRDHRPGLRPRRAAAVHGVRPRHRRPRTGPRSRAPPSGPSARPCRRPRRMRTASTASSCRSATTRCGPARAAAPRSPRSRSASTEDTDPGLLAVPQAR